MHACHNMLCMSWHTLHPTLDWIWEKPASTHDYKLPSLIIWSIVTQEGKQMHGCMKFATIL